MFSKTKSNIKCIAFCNLQDLNFKIIKDVMQIILDSIFGKILSVKMIKEKKNRPPQLPTG